KRSLDGAGGIVDQPAERAVRGVVDAEALVGCRLGEDDGTAAVGKPAGTRLDRGAEIEDLAIPSTVDIDEPDLRAGGMAVAPGVEDPRAFLVEQRAEGVRLRRPRQGDAFAAGEILEDDGARLGRGARRGVEIGGEDEIAAA